MAFIEAVALTLGITLAAFTLVVATAGMIVVVYAWGYAFLRKVVLGVLIVGTLALSGAGCGPQESEIKEAIRTEADSTRVVLIENTRAMNRVGEQLARMRKQYNCYPLPPRLRLED